MGSTALAHLLPPSEGQKSKLPTWSPLRLYAQGPFIMFGVEYYQNVFVLLCCSFLGPLTRKSKIFLGLKIYIYFSVPVGGFSLQGFSSSKSRI